MVQGPEFDRRLARRAERIVVNAEKAVRETAVVVDQVVTVGTPVDTGRARSNWQASIDSPATSVVSPLDTSGQGAMSLARAVIRRFKSGTNRAVHITNNLPYIRLLDAGSSAQAPSGMTAKAVQAAREVVRRSKLLD